MKGKEEKPVRVKEEDKKVLMTVWRKSAQDNNTMTILQDMFHVSPQEIRRVITEESIKRRVRIQQNTEANRSLYASGHF